MAKTPVQKTQPEPAVQGEAASQRFGRGLALGFGAYLIWGSFPLIISMVKFFNQLLELLAFKLNFFFHFSFQLAY